MITAATDSTIAALTEGVWEWLTDADAWGRCCDEISERREWPDFDQHLADWCEDTMREDASDGLGSFILHACRVADWSVLTARVLDAWANSDDAE